jgi:hypothetical protein
MEEPSWLRAGAWERSVAEQWARDAAADGSLRHRLLDELCMSIESLVREAVSDGDIATSVIAELLLTLRHCDELDFKTEAQCLAYVCWHLADRYGRTQQALDALFAGGHLPVRVRGASIVEVGSGPAPAVHATGDYYRHLYRWCADSSQPGHMVPLLRADTLGRGLGWDARPRFWATRRCWVTVSLPLRARRAVDLRRTAYRKPVGLRDHSIRSTAWPRSVSPP